MRFHGILTRLLPGMVLVFTWLVVPAFPQKTKATAAGPAHQVAAMYFHRTNRCPTCRKISAYIEEAIQTGFPKELKDGRVKVSMIDFQNKKNKKYTEAYKITGPTLVLADIHNGKATAWKPAPKVWKLVRDKEAFFRYIGDEVRSYLETK